MITVATNSKGTSPKNVITKNDHSSSVMIIFIIIASNSRTAPCELRRWRKRWNHRDPRRRIWNVQNGNILADVLNGHGWNDLNSQYTMFLWCCWCHWWWCHDDDGNDYNHLTPHQVSKGMIPWWRTCRKERWPNFFFNTKKMESHLSLGSG